MGISLLSLGHSLAQTFLRLPGSLDLSKPAGHHPHGRASLCPTGLGAPVLPQEIINTTHGRMGGGAALPLVKFVNTWD